MEDDSLINAGESQEDESFYKQMDDNPSAVYVVEAYNSGERECLALFSTKEKAQYWISLQKSPRVVCPFVIDEPDFGNARVQ